MSKHNLESRQFSQLVEIAAGHGLHPCASLEDQGVSVKDEPMIDVRLRLVSEICAGNDTKYAKGVQGAHGEP